MFFFLLNFLVDLINVDLKNEETELFSRNKLKELVLSYKEQGNYLREDSQIEYKKSQVEEIKEENTEEMSNISKIDMISVNSHNFLKKINKREASFLQATSILTRR